MDAKELDYYSGWASTQIAFMGSMAQDKKGRREFIMTYLSCLKPELVEELQKCPELWDISPEAYAIVLDYTPKFKPEDM